MRVGIVVGICIEHDAISAAAAGQAELMQAMDAVSSVDVFTTFSDRPVGAPVHQHHSSWSMFASPEFQRCDVVIFHWGIYTQLFDAVWAVDPLCQRVIVHFHNTTPPELASNDEDRVALAQGLHQIEAVAALPVRVWTYSEFNRRSLLAIGVPPERIGFVPFVIEAPRSLPERSAAPHTGHVEVLCVGRLVPAKGTMTLIEAFALLGAQFRLVIVGNRETSSGSYFEQLTQRVAALGLQGAVRFVHPDDAELWQLYEAAHIVVSPSLHEGLCVPVIEGYLAGCRAVGTTAGNLPFVVQPPDEVVPPGDPEQLAAAIERAATRVGQPHPLAQELCALFSSVSVAQRLHEELAIGGASPRPWPGPAAEHVS